MTHRLINPKLVLTGLCCLVLGGCGSSVGLGLNADGGGSEMSATPGYGSSATASSGATTTTSTSSSSSGSGAMAGMNMGSTTSSTPPKVKGVPKPVATQVLTTAYWQGMKIEAMTTTPVRFLTVSGNDNSITEHMVKPPKGSSFHLMVMLNDEHTSYPIPYASVWATISQGKHVLWSEQQWPMISAYMGPHYGNDVPHLKPGNYKLTLLISPPLVARHVEYENVWTKKHTVSANFTWNGK